MSFLPANPEQKKILKSFCEKEIEHQRDYLIEKYELKDYNPQLYLNWRTNAVASYGGELNNGSPFVSILALEVCQHVGKVGKFIYEEYDFLANKEGIGNGTANWKQHISWTIAHEMAHTLVECDALKVVVQPFFDYETACDLRGHGKLWQAIYRDLRVNFCVEERYPVEAIDFSKSIYSTQKKVKGEDLITFYRGEKACGYYIRSKGKIFKSNRDFVTKKPTKYQNPAEIRKRLVSA